MLNGQLGVLGQNAASLVGMALDQKLANVDLRLNSIQRIPRDLALEMERKLSPAWKKNAYRVCKI